MFDAVDYQIIHALQLQARIPFSRIAAVIGVSDQTVARRYSRLRSSGGLKVRGLVDPHLGGHAPWLLRLQCSPNSTATVAAALARRDDTAWVRLTSGGAEIVCMVNGNKDEEQALLLDRLPRTPQVKSVTAHQLLRTFSRGLQLMVADHSGLTAQQIAELGSPPKRVPDQPVAIGAADEPLLKALAADARTELSQLATVTHRSQSSVRRRIIELVQHGLLTFETEIDERIFSATRSWFLLWATVEPASLETVGNALAADPQVGYVAATTGPTNLYAAVAGPHSTALYSFLTDRIAQLPGIRTVESAPVLRNVKRNA